jgi:hypothetical protein
MSKLFVTVRKDLSHSQRAVQAGHAVAQYMLNCPNSSWKNQTLIYLGVKGLNQLENLKMKLRLRGTKFVEFKEPDIGNQTTAIASDTDDPIFNKLNLL